MAIHFIQINKFGVLHYFCPILRDIPWDLDEQAEISVSFAIYMVGEVVR